LKTGFLAQALAAVMMMFLTTTHAEACTKRSQSANVAFKHQHPCLATGSPNGPCEGYVIDHIVPVACHRADAPSNMQWQTVADAKSKRQVGGQGVREVSKPPKTGWAARHHAASQSCASVRSRQKRFRLLR
jgi:hypothetical protein